jgi:hypothetical protein
MAQTTEEVVMPSTTLERRELIYKWFGEDADDYEVMRFLRTRGFEEVFNGVIRPPVPHHNISKDEWECIMYLIEEWDFAFENIRPYEPSGG